MRIEDCKMEGNRLVLSLHRDGMVDARRFLIHFKPGEYTLTKAKKKRSLDANSKMWALCRDIGAAIGEPALNVYRRAIQAGNVFDVIKIKAFSFLERFESTWEAHGDGWFCVVTDETGDGDILVRAYYGSSTFTVQEMSDLIDRLIQDAKSIGLETMSEREKSLLLEDWGKGK